VADLIPAPDLEIRDEEHLAAEAIGRTSGPLTVSIIDSQIESLRRLRDLVAGDTLAPPICPELTNANPSAPHTVTLEAFAWLLAFIARRINQFPKRDQIEFARLFKIELRDASPAQTTLRFFVEPPNGVDVTVPLGTQVSTEDGTVVFETTVELVITFGNASGDVEARNTLIGPTLLAPDVLVKMVDPIAWVESVTNPDAVDSGGDEESIEAALERARSYQRRGERLVSTRDFEEAILQDALSGSGIVKGFPFVALGDFDGASKPGYSTIVVMTSNGNAIDELARHSINALLEQRVGNQVIAISDPIYVTFNVVATVRLTSGAPQSGTLAMIETNLRSFYKASEGNFGRDIKRSEVIAVIEGTQGVDRIESIPNGPIIDSPLADVSLRPWQLPKVVAVTLSVV
jgi:uncharacterized phage protein gp47/JayE